MAVPFMDLRTQYLSLKSEMDTAIQAVIDRTAFVGGGAVGEFEREFAIHCDTRACVGVSNGTDAIALALQALGVGQGDEVITVPNTFIATVEAITMVGATPRFCDVDADTHLMDPAAFEAAITDRTRAVIPVHLYGQTCDMDRIRPIADANGVLVIEDAAQAHGATCRGRRAGSMGHAACFSFYPGKNLGAYGDAGAVTSNDLDLVERVRCLANHGRASHTEHALAGRNCRLDGIQAAVLRVKLPHLETWNQARREAAVRYDEMFADMEAVQPVRVAKGMESVYHLYVVQVPDRDGLRAHLQERGIGCGLHYRLPVHLTEAYQDLAIPTGSFPVAESLQEHIISLPMFPEITPEMQAEVVAAVREFVEVEARA